MPTTSIYTPQTTTHFYVETCYKCGIVFGMPTKFQEFMERDQGTFYCPNGHGQSYLKSTEQLLREQLERERDNGAYWRREYSAMDRRRAAAKGQLTKALNRTKKGQCIHCDNRTFTDLAAHYQVQHPNEAERVLTEVDA